MLFGTDRGLFGTDHGLFGTDRARRARFLQEDRRLVFPFKDKTREVIKMSIIRQCALILEEICESKYLIYGIYMVRKQKSTDAFLLSTKSYSQILYR